VDFPSDEGAAGVQAACGKRLKRLVALKDRSDPDNIDPVTLAPPMGGGTTRVGTAGAVRCPQHDPWPVEATSSSKGA
jgi:hypothetical protein